jgi:hypothetical protein
MADRHVVGVQVVLADRPHDYFATVQSYPDLETPTPLQPQLLGVTLDCLLHVQRRMNRPLRVVFVGDRRSE